MKIVSMNGQMTFEEMKGSLDQLPKVNRWVQMGDMLPWTEFERAYNKRLNNDSVGASNIPGRIAIAALIIRNLKRGVLRLLAWWLANVPR